MKVTSVGLAKRETVLYHSCTHIGNPNRHEEGTKRFFERAKKHKWIHLGDIIESIMPCDSRYSVEEHVDSVLGCIGEAVSYVESARKTCIGLIMGNHEYKLSRKLGNITKKIALDAQVPFGSHTMATYYHHGANGLSAFAAHGAGNIRARTSEPERNEANMKIRLRNLLKDFQFELKVIGHFHRVIVAEAVYEERLSLDGMLDLKRRPQNTRTDWCIACPSLFSNYVPDSVGSYAEAALMPPTDLGWMEIDTEKCEVKCVRHVNEDGKTQKEFYPVYFS